MTHRRSRSDDDEAWIDEGFGGVGYIGQLTEHKPTRVPKKPPIGFNLEELYKARQEREKEKQCPKATPRRRVSGTRSSTPSSGKSTEASR